MKKVQLYSGGMDSWIIDKLWKPDIKLFFDIGTKNNKQELKRVKNDPTVKIIKLPLAEFEEIDNNYYLPLRNLHFVLHAAHYGDVICLGATGSSTHKDKNDTFATLSENAINYLLSETKRTGIKIVMPYKNVSKTDMLAMYLKQGGDIEKCYKETFSCYNPDKNGHPCMNCTSCFSKFTAFYNNGYKFNNETTHRFAINVLKNKNAKPDSVNLANKILHAKRICIDFDNTITNDSVFPQTGSLRPGCKDFLSELKKQGYQVSLYTSRTGMDFENCKEYCKQLKLPIDEYISGKPLAQAYLDDKAINFNGDWDNAKIMIYKKGEKHVQSN